MGISRRTDYGVRVLLYLAMHPADKFVPQEIIAQSMEIPGTYLPKIIRELTRAGFVQTMRGGKGGCRLLRSPQQVNFLEIIEALEGGIALNSCLIPHVGCSRMEQCAVHDFWGEANELLRRTLASRTLADLAVQSAKKAKKFRSSLAADR